MLLDAIAILLGTIRRIGSAPPPSGPPNKKAYVRLFT